MGTEVLVKSINCGVFPALRFFELRTPFIGAYHADQINNAANYAQQCYSNSSGGVLDCERFVTKKIASKIDRKAACPFRDDICRDPSSNIRIDSGYLSSQDHFGLNSPPDNRILWRYVYHCAPLVTKGYTNNVNTSSGEATLYHYGNFSDLDGDKDYIFAAKSLESQNMHSLIRTSVSNFDLQ